MCPASESVSLRVFLTLPYSFELLLGSVIQKGQILGLYLGENFERIPMVLAWDLLSLKELALHSIFAT